MTNFIYRGYTVMIEDKGLFSVKVYEGNEEVFVCRKEEEAYDFIDKTKKELRKNSS